jgi:probable phosphoglycerate mutase
MKALTPSHLSSADSELMAYIDGGSRGNPGPAGYGVVIQDAKGKALDTLSRSIGKATNNVAEYHALLAALEYATARQSRRLKIYCDSELVVRQMQGRYRVQSPDLKPLYQQARELASRLERFAIEHVPREQNSVADRLANEAMDQAAGSPGAPVLSFSAVVEAGRLRPLSPAPALEEGAEYEVRLRRQLGNLRRARA